MFTRLYWFAFAVVAFVVAFSATATLAQRNPAEEARLKKLDAGPKTIDVTQYPAEQQAAYKLFQAKCSKCHNIARAIGSEMVVPAEWERYIRRMMYKPDSGISNNDGRALYRFLVYDASIRKADSLRKALAALPAADQAAAVQAIASVNPTFVR